MKKMTLTLAAFFAAVLIGVPGYASINGDTNRRVADAQSLTRSDSRRSIPKFSTDNSDGLDKAVVKAAIVAKEKQVAANYGVVTEPVVEPQRRSANGDWVFGGVYFPIPFGVMDATPVTSLFVAYKASDEDWTVLLEGDEQFESVLLQAPKELVSDRERKVFSKRAAAKRSINLFSVLNAQDIQLSLPFERNGAIWGHSGVHGNGGNTRPFNAIDFWGGDNRVRASRGGIAYKFCTNSTTSRWPYIEVVHDNGWTTGYYHTKDQADLASGQPINEGDFIGMIGVELPCGGGATGNHVHWTLWRGDQNGTAEAVNGKTIGGWTWYEGAAAYEGFAERNGVRVNARNSGLVNYGYFEPWEATVDNTTAGRFAASGNWGVSDYSAERYGANYAYTQPLAVSDAAWFKFNIPATGAYEVFVWYPANSGYNSATPFVIATATGNRVVRVNQQINGGQWVSLGVHQLAGGDYNAVGVSRWTSTAGYVIADAVRIVRR